MAVEAVASGLALALTVAVGVDGGPLPGDLRLAGWAQDLPGWLEDPFEGVRYVCGTQFVMVTGGLYALGLMLKGCWREGVALGVALLALPVMQSTIKEVVDRPRPDPALVDRRAGFTSESFPSGHMMSGFVLYALLAVVGWELLRRPWREVVAGALVALLVADAVANVYMGVHWPSDVLGGLLWGLVIVVPAAWAFAARSPTGRRRSGAEDFAGR